MDFKLANLFETIRIHIFSKEFQCVNSTNVILVSMWTLFCPCWALKTTVCSFWRIWSPVERWGSSYWCLWENRCEFLYVVKRSIHFGSGCVLLLLSCVFCILVNISVYLTTGLWQEKKNNVRSCSKTKY